MSNDRVSRILRCASLILVVGLLIPISCGQAPPLAPEEGAPRSDINIVGISVPGDVSLQGGKPKVKVEIGPEGGTIEIPGFIRVDVPAGAVDKKENFEIKIKKLDKYEWELKPHKEEFNVPVTLTVFLANAVIEYDEDGDPLGWEIEDGISPDDLEVYWKNTCYWWPQGAVYDSAQNAMVVELEHFSRYALATE
jgi:hypothetical protein